MYYRKTLTIKQQ